MKRGYGKFNKKKERQQTVSPFHFIQRTGLNNPQTFKFWTSKKKFASVLVTGFLLFLVIGGMTYQPNVHALIGYDAQSHTRSTIYQTPSSFGSGTGSTLQNFAFNSTNSRAFPNGICVSTQSANQIRFNYQVGKTATNLGFPLGGVLYGAAYEPTDYGNGIDVASQHKIFYAQGRWWTFYINGTGANANKIIFTSSTSGSNATGSWATPTVTSFFGTPLNYATWNNNTHVILQFTNSSGIGNHVSIAVGTLNSAGTIAFTGEQIALAGMKGPSFDLQYIFTGVYLGTPSEGFPVLVASEVDAYTHGFSDNAHRTSINATVTFATNTAYTTWSNPLTIISATGVNVTGPPNPGGGPPTRWNPTIDTMANGDVYVTAGSATQTGQLGVFGVAFHTGSKTFATVDTIIPKSTNPLNPVTGSGTFNIFPGIDFLPLVEGTASESNQTLGFAIRTGSTWGSLVNPTVRGGYNVNVQDLSQFLVYDSLFHELALFSQTSGQLGINAAFSDDNGTTWTNRQTIYTMTAPTQGNVSNTFNRNGVSQYAVTVSDGTRRWGNFWTEGTGTSQVQANGYKLMFGSVLSPHGTPQFGNNCNSASIVEVKTPINLAQISGRQLELFMGMDCQSDGVKAACLGTDPDLADFEFVLRTNSTLPGFAEGWNPFTDIASKLIFQVRQGADGTWSQYIWEAHGTQTSIFGEGSSNDLVLSSVGTTPGIVCHSGLVKLYNQAIINYTGVGNTLFFEANDGSGVNPCGTGFNIFSTSCPNVFDSNCPGPAPLQSGLDYFLFIKADWGPDLLPQPGQFIDFRTGDTETVEFPKNSGTITPTTSSIYTVPSCGEDPICLAGSVQYSVQIDPFNPSSWANAIIKGIAWAGTQAFNALLSFIGIVEPAIISALVFLQGIVVSVMNGIGNAIGLGNVGSNAQQLINSLITFFSQSVPTAFTNLSAIVARTVDSLTILYTWIPIAFSIASNLLTLGINGVVFVLTIVQDIFLLWDTMIVLMLILFWFADVGEFGLSGYLAWIETFKYLVFGLGIRLVTLVVNFALDVVTYLIGLVPKPFVQMVAHSIPRLPIIDISGQPTWPSFNMQRVRDGDYFAVLGFLIGVIVIVWFETTSLPGSITALVPGVGTSLTRLSSIPKLLLIFLEIFGFMALFILPAQLFQSMGLGVTPETFGNVRFQRGVPIQQGKVSIGVHRATKRFQKTPEQELQQLQQLKESGKLKKAGKIEEKIRQRELREVHGKDIKGPEL